MKPPVTESSEFVERVKQPGPKDFEVMAHRSRSAGVALSYKLIAPSSASHTFQLGNDIEIIETLENTVTKNKEKNM